MHDAVKSEKPSLKMPVVPGNFRVSRVFSATS